MKSAKKTEESLIEFIEFKSESEVEMNDTATGAPALYHHVKPDKYKNKNGLKKKLTKLVLPRETRKHKHTVQPIASNNEIRLGVGKG